MLFPVLCVIFMALGIVTGMWTFAYIFNDQPKQKKKKDNKRSKQEPVPDQAIGLTDEYYSQLPEEEADQMRNAERRKQTSAYNYTKRAKEGIR